MFDWDWHDFNGSIRRYKDFLRRSENMSNEGEISGVTLKAIHYMCKRDNRNIPSNAVELSKLFALRRDSPILINNQEIYGLDQFKARLLNQLDVRSGKDVSTITSFVDYLVSNLKQIVPAFFALDLTHAECVPLMAALAVLEGRFPLLLPKGVTGALQCNDPFIQIELPPPSLHCTPIPNNNYINQRTSINPSNQFYNLQHKPSKYAQNPLTPQNHNNNPLYNNNKDFVNVPQHQHRWPPGAPMSTFRERSRSRSRTPPIFRPTGFVQPEKLLPAQQQKGFISIQHTLTDGKGKKVLGQSTIIEKAYLRLTDFANPKDVRTESTLRKSLPHVLARFAKEKDSLGGWRWLDEQLRSIRQDLKVQGIENEFTAEVYERNVISALENKDLGQANICLTQLKVLHSKGLGGANRVEFAVYRLLYSLLQGGQILGSLKESENGVYGHLGKWLLAIRGSIVEGRWRQFFCLVEKCPFECELLVSLFRREFMIRAIARLSGVLRGGVPLEWLGTQLHDDNSCTEIRNLLADVGVVVDKDNKVDLWTGKDQLASHPLLTKRKSDAMG